MTGRCADADIAPQLDLSFRHHPARGTWLDRRVFRWPYTLSRGFRLDTAPPGTLTLILQTMSGAIQADDRLAQRIHVGPDAAAHIMTQGATPVYRAPTGTSAEDNITLDLEDGGCIDYMPELRILFPDASLTQRIRVRLPPSATAIVADGFVMHDPHGMDRPFRRYRSHLRLQRPDGTLLATDRLALDAAPRGRGRPAQYVAHGTLIVATCRPKSCLEALCADAEARMAAVPGLYAAASMMPNDAGAALRLAAIDGRHLRLGLQAGWAAARLHVFGREPTQRRI